jgi:PAS domain S-box-containing protein
MAAQGVKLSLIERPQMGRLEELFARAPSFMALLEGPEHRFVLANPAYEALIGRKPQVGRVLREVLPELAQQGFLELLDHVWRTGEAFVGRDIAVELQRRPGEPPEERFLDFVFQPIRDEDGGKVVAIFVEGADITGRRRAEQQAHEVDIGRQIAMQAADLGRWDHRPMENKRFFDARAREILGFGLADPIDLIASLDVVHPDDRDRMARAASDAMDPERAGPYVEEFRLARPDPGGDRWVSVNGRSYFENGQCVRFAGVMADITERKRGEAQLKATERLLRDLNASLAERVAERTRQRDRIWALSQDLLAEMGVDGSLHAVNPAWTQLLGHSEATLITRQLADLLHAEDHGRFTDMLERLKTGSPTERFEVRLRNLEGGYRWIAWTATAEGDVFYAVGRDITAEREAADALRQTEEALRQSQKMEAVGQLTGGIAHDFNNLLTGIMGSLDLMKRRIESGRVRELDRLMDAALASAQRAAALTHRLLAFARRQSLDAAPVDPNGLIGSMEELLHRTLGEQVQLQIELAPDAWQVLADANQLESAVLNLSINARDAMPDGGRLTIATANAHFDAVASRDQQGLKSGDYVQIRVSDTGEGMSPDVAAKAFDPFFTTKPIGQGTGLGLSMVYGFARQSGGHVSLESREGEGATITLYLPRAETAEAPAEPEPLLRPARGEGETVLVVEDDPAVRLLVLEVLSELGYVGLEASDSQGALQILGGRERIDLLISDVGLPGGLNGRQLAEIAREQRPELPVLFVTGYAERAAERRGFLAPGMQMITKPFDMEALAAKVKEIIAGVPA